MDGRRTKTNNTKGGDRDSEIAVEHMQGSGGRGSCLFDEGGVDVGARQDVRREHDDDPKLEALEQTVLDGELRLQAAQDAVHAQHAEQLEQAQQLENLEDLGGAVDVAAALPVV